MVHAYARHLTSLLFFCLSADHRFGGYLTSDVSDWCTFLPLCALLKGEIKGPELFLWF